MGIPSIRLSDFILLEIFLLSKFCIGSLGANADIPSV